MKGLGNSLSLKNSNSKRTDYAILGVKGLSKIVCKHWKVLGLIRLNDWWFGKPGHQS